MKQLRDLKSAASEKALLVQVICGRRDRDEAADSLHELERLADTAGAIVAGSITQRRDRPTPGFFIGEGKLADIQLACRQAKANLIIFDNDLSPIQVNNLDLAIGTRVIDRTELILQIFARRAASAEAQIQVELAQLQYLISRIPVSEKQARFKGGIGMKGPGESPLQLRNEPMRRRIRDLKRKLDLVQQRRERTMSSRKWPMVCLVGYTNAGKSTLLNTLAPLAKAYVDDRLFATLDTKTRLVKLPGKKDVLVSDTVGFIRHLPHGLVASFRSTLDVARNADLLLVVTDAGQPRFDDQIAVVHDTLGEIGADRVQYLLVLNKCDTPAAQAALPSLLAAHPGAITISALKNDGILQLKEAIAERTSHVVSGGHTDR